MKPVPPTDEILPKNDPAHDGKSRQAKPRAGGGIGNAREHGKLLRVQSLIEPPFLDDLIKAYLTQLFVARHDWPGG